MCIATLGATPVNLCTCAASAIFSCGVRGTPGWANTLNRVPVLPNAHDGVSIRCALRAVFTVVRSGISRHLQATEHGAAESVWLTHAVLRGSRPASFAAARVHGSTRSSTVRYWP